MRPHWFRHRGTVHARGYLWRTEWLALDRIADRIIAHWTPGARVFNQGSRWVLVREGAQAVDADDAPGEPLVLVGPALCALPLTRDDVKALAAGAGERGDRGLASVLPTLLIDAFRGRVGATNLARFHEVEPASWLDTRELEVLEPHSLGAPAAPPAVDAKPVTVDVREALGVGQAQPSVEDMARAIARAQTERAQGSPPATSAAGPREGSESRGGTSAGAAPSGPSLMGRLRAWASRTLAGSRLAEALGRRQARYINELRDLFDRGDLDEALRRALPTSNRSADKVELDLGLPERRRDLELRLRRPSGVGSVNLVSGWFDDLRATYRNAFKQLVAAGRIDEAAFVLLELLDEPEECVALLEHHGRARKAAEIAEARQLAPGLVVRLWFVAGNASRAVDVARRTGAFADAVARLERSRRHDEATRLRLLWADSEASAGNYAAAVDIAWSVRAAESLVETWMERAIEAGGNAGAAMLARKLARLPEAFDDVAARVQALCSTTAGTPQRLALAAALVDHPSDGGRVVAQPLVRALMRDSYEHPDAVTNRATRALAHAAGGLVDVDLPPLLSPRGRQRAQGSPPPIERAIGAADSGPLDITDVVPLPSGGALAALGETGCALVNRRGEVSFIFDAPSQHLVIADSGIRALVLAERGDVITVHRLELDTRRTERIGDVELQCWARTYDGATWYAGDREDVWAFDAQANDVRTTWRVPGVNPIRVLRRTKSLEVIDAAGAVWRYQLPGPLLRERTELSGRPQVPMDIAFDGALVGFSWTSDADDAPPRPGPLEIFEPISKTVAPLPFGDVDDSLVVRFCRGRVVVARRHDQGLAVLMYRTLVLPIPSTPWATFDLRGATRAVARSFGPKIALADDRGRVLIIDTESTSVIADWRPRLAPPRR